MLEVGSKAPDFTLDDQDGNPVKQTINAPANFIFGGRLIFKKGPNPPY